MDKHDKINLLKTFAEDIIYVIDTQPDPVAALEKRLERFIDEVNTDDHSDKKLSTNKEKLKTHIIEFEALLNDVTEGEASVLQQDHAYMLLNKISFYTTRVLLYK